MHWQIATGYVVMLHAIHQCVTSIKHLLYMCIVLREVYKSLRKLNYMCGLFNDVFSTTNYVVWNIWMTGE